MYLYATCLHAAVWLIIRVLCLLPLKEAVLPQPVITPGLWNSCYSAKR